MRWCYLSVGNSALALRLVQSGTTSLDSGAASKNIVLSTALLDKSRAFLVFGVTSSAVSTAQNNSYVRGAIASTTGLQFNRVTSTTSTLNIRYYVAEFSSGLSVNHVACQIANTFSGNYTCASSSSPLSQLAFIGSIASSGSGLGPNSEAALYVTESGGTRYAATIKAGTSGSVDVDGQFIDFGTNATVYHGTINMTSGVDTSKESDALTGPPAANKVWPYVSCTNDSGSANVADLGITSSYNAATGKIKVQRSDHTGNATCYYQAIVFNDDTIVLGNNSTNHSYASGDASKTTCASGCDYTESSSFTTNKSIAVVRANLGVRAMTNDNTGQIHGMSFKVDIASVANKISSIRENTQGSGDTAEVGWNIIEFPRSRRILKTSD